MRLILNFTKNTEPVPTDNQKNINSYIHKCLGNNNKYHDAQSDYNVSMLLGSSFNLNTLEFPNGGKLVVSSNDIEFINTLLNGVTDNPDLFCGMKYKNIDFINENFYNGVNTFYSLSPILLKETIADKKYLYITTDNADFNEILTKRTLNKLIAINDKQLLKLKFNDFKIICSSNNKNKVRKVTVKNVINVASQCIVSVTCNKEVAELIYNLGLGQSTGSGFGCVCNVENINRYKHPQ